MRRRTLPLGVDLGRHRIRVALAERDQAESRLIAVAARDVADDPVAALVDAMRELATRERRCVLALGIPEATLRPLSLPAMSGRERRQAARFAAARHHGDEEPRIVTLSPLPDPHTWVLGAARTEAVAWRRATAAAAGLRTVAVDDLGLALRRVQRGVDGIIDIAAESTRVIAFADPVPYASEVPVGGNAFTAAIADALGIDLGLAEARKRAVGFAGAGEGRRDAFIASGVAAIGAAHAAGMRIQSLAMTGNGSRVPGLADAFTAAAGIPIAPAELDESMSATLPGDVLRAAGPDWSLAVGLALWAVAR